MIFTIRSKRHDRQSFRPHLKTRLHFEFNAGLISLGLPEKLEDVNWQDDSADRQ